MATNQLSPFGLRPTRHMSTLGNVNEEYQIASGYGTNIGQFDQVKLVAGGTIEKCAVGDTPIGIFMGYRIDDRGKQGSLTNLIPWGKDFVAGSSNASGQSFQAMVINDPQETLYAQVMGTVSAADRGALVDFIPQSVNSVFGTSMAGVSQVAVNNLLATAVVGAGGTGYDATTTATVNTDGGGYGGEVSLTIVGGVITAATIVSAGTGYTGIPTVTITDPTGSGDGAAAVTVTIAAEAARSMYVIERILEQPIHIRNTAGADIGFGLSGTGEFGYVELKYAKHQRGGASLAVAV